MSLETNTNKIAANLQQLTDAIVTLTAVLQLNNEQPANLVDQPQVTPETITIGGEFVPKSQTINPDDSVTTPGTVVVEPDNVVGITKSVAHLTTMAEANTALQEVVQQMGDGGVGVRGLLQKHNAISLGQIPEDQFASFVEEARALVGVA